MCAASHTHIIPQSVYAYLIKSTEKVSLTQQVCGVPDFMLIEVAQCYLTKTILTFRTRSMEQRAV